MATPKLMNTVFKPRTTEDAPAITTDSPLNGQVGQAYEEQLEGSDATHWRYDGGDVVPGLALSAGGVLSGTPTAAGTYSFHVLASGPGGAVPAEFEITIAPAD